jgi:uncharacterized repeat protein (TIGR03803 family)
VEFVAALWQTLPKRLLGRIMSFVEVLRGRAPSRVFGVFLLVAVCAALGSGVANASAYSILYKFCSKANCTDGQEPLGGLVRDSAGNLYGTTLSGGNYDGGTVFELVRDGSKWKHKTLHDFCQGYDICPDGQTPNGNLIVDAAGNLYGTTEYGDGYGNVFELSPPAPGRTLWRLKVLHDFCWNCADGYEPNAGLSYLGHASGAPYDGVSPLFGTTYLGGAYGGGVVYQLSPGKKKGGWPESVVYSYCSNCAAGDPSGPLLVTDANTIYGTAYGSNEQVGIVFKLTSNAGQWAETVLYTFCSQQNCADGAGPTGGLLVDGQGNIFGTAVLDGPNCNDEYCGAAYELAPNGTYTVLHGFCYADNSCAGSTPGGGLIRDGQGNIFGTTDDGGKKNNGVLYELNGTYTVLHDFCQKKNCPDGALPDDSLTMESSGIIYGATKSGGNIVGGSGAGLVYALTP